MVAIDLFFGLDTDTPFKPATLADVTPLLPEVGSVLTLPPNIVGADPKIWSVAGVTIGGATTGVLAAMTGNFPATLSIIDAMTPGNAQAWVTAALPTVITSARITGEGFVMDIDFGDTVVTAQQFAIDWTFDDILALSPTINGVPLGEEPPVEDPLAGTAGPDSILGTDGDDTLDGLEGDDTILGEEGNDSIAGSAGDDSLGGGGGDVIAGGLGDDWIRGGAGRDSLSGGDGLDTIIGANGNDFIDGGAGNDEPWDGADNDTILGFDGDDLIGGGIGNDSIQGAAGLDVIWGGDGSDTLRGGAENDTLGGGTGDDVVLGASGADQIWGASGRDTLNGGENNDTLGGGDGDDIILGGEGNDVIYGGSGADRLQGGAGNDPVWGGPGGDVFIFGAGDGADVFEFFNAADGDRLLLTGTLWGGGLTAADVVTNFATINGAGNVQFDFAGGESFELNGVTSLAGLDSVIDIVG